MIEEPLLSPTSPTTEFDSSLLTDDSGSDSDTESLATAPDSFSWESPSVAKAEAVALDGGEKAQEMLIEPAPTSVEYTVPFEEHFGTLPQEWEGFRPEEYEYAYSW